MYINNKQYPEFNYVNRNSNEGMITLLPGAIWLAIILSGLVFMIFIRRRMLASHKRTPTVKSVNTRYSELTGTLLSFRTSTSPTPSDRR